MCITNTEPVKRKTGVGYKIFDVRNDQLRSEFCGGDEPRPIRQWLKATGGSSRYGAGWHIFPSLKAAKGWYDGDGSGQVIRKVKYRKAFLSGRQGSLTAIVAKEIYIFRGAK